MAASRFGLPSAVAPAKAASGAQRSFAWSEPEPWIVALLLATGVAVIARHPIARAIGTEVDDTTMTPSVVATAPPSTAAPAAPSLAAVQPVPTHAPRDPFHALIDAGSALAAQAATTARTTSSDMPQLLAAPIPLKGTGTTVTASSAPTTPVPATPTVAAAVGTCTGTVHTVAAGESLWTIAAKTVKSADTAKVTVAWHRIYAANQPPLGDNPSLVPVGTKLCVPSSI